jgi:hypothetical protein
MYPGITVSKHTIQKHMCDVRSRGGGSPRALCPGMGFDVHDHSSFDPGEKFRFAMLTRSTADLRFDFQQMRGNWGIASRRTGGVGQTQTVCKRDQAD